MLRPYPLVAFALAAAAVLSGPALACDSYRKIERPTALYDQPDAGLGLPVAMLPVDASVCVVGEEKDATGATWLKADFYAADQIVFRRAGWLAKRDLGAAPTGAAAEKGHTVPLVAAATTRTADPIDAEGFFGRDWALDGTRSKLQFISAKKNEVFETHSFGELSGGVAKTGEASVDVSLSSVDTGVDLRNVRMRFLLFQVDANPKATITARLDPAKLRPLVQGKIVEDTIPVTLKLRGKEKTYDVPVRVERVDAGTVRVTSVKPVVVEGKDFDMLEGVKKLSEAVGSIDIVPAAPVLFDLVFVAG